MNATIKIIPDAGSNNLTFSKNFRIFSIPDPIQGITSIVDILEEFNFFMPPLKSFSSMLDVSPAG